MQGKSTGAQLAAPQKAVIYLRVSTEEQVDNYSLDTQEDICTKEAERRGLSVLEVFSEKGKSAKTISGRPTLIEMLEFCRKHKREIGAVIVYRLDRISRQTADYLSIRKKLAECEIDLVSATEPTGNTPTEKFIETMLAGFAQMDNDVKGERAKNGMRARFLSGLPNGGVPLGYSAVSGYAVKNPETFTIMKEAWELMATGTKSVQDMCGILNAKGIRLQRKGHKEYLICDQTLNKIFHNKFYMGKVVSRKYGLEVQGQHTPMITEELYYRVQDILSGRNRMQLTKRNIDKPEFPLRRFLKCGVCHKSFTAAWSKGKRSYYGYYFCQDRCMTPSSVPLAEVDKEKTKELLRTSPKPETVELCLWILRKEYYERINSLHGKRDRAEVELKNLYSTRQALIEKNLAGTYSDDIFKEQNKALEEKITAIQIAKNDSIIEKYDLEAMCNFVKARLSDVDGTYEKSNPGAKKVFLCSIFPEGMLWGYPGISNTKKSPFYKTLFGVKSREDNYGAPRGDRTPDPLFRRQMLYPLSYGRANLEPYK
jgi:site-specific DNA recombinase